MYRYIGVFVLFVVSLENIAASEESCADEANTPTGAWLQAQHRGYELWKCVTSAKEAYYTCSTNSWYPEKLQCGPKPGFKESCLTAHNTFRNMHQDTPALTYSDDLAKSAKEWADHLTSIGKLQHSRRDSYGENIYWTSMSSKYDPCSSAVHAWYKEQDNYSYFTTKSKTSVDPIGHFTQVVWRDSREIGCGLSESTDGTYVVCRYSPQGNFVLRNSYEGFDEARRRVYGANVLPLKPGANIQDHF
ncbi:unnamed protein product [Owenia fusiformis]|uniref:Uncharacterized protein n=1 Tax=Owenia fusiformis TaxID=6347 RepID=A0A8J1XSG7_OWEFU|nr:unnamed protein product [Owenia fusiformis]